MLIVISSLLLLSCKAETLNFEWEMMETSMDPNLPSIKQDPYPPISDGRLT